MLTIIMVIPERITIQRFYGELATNHMGTVWQYQSPELLGLDNLQETVALTGGFHQVSCRFLGLWEPHWLVSLEAHD